MKHLIGFLLILAAIGYVLEALGIDVEPQREDSLYVEECDCSYDYQGTILPLRAPDKREEKVYRELMQLHGIPKKKYILCATNKDIPGGFAGFATLHQGKRYIVYDRESAIKSSHIWIVKLLGHEIGHQYLDHVSNHTRSWEEETEADEFSGWSLYKYGYSYDRAINTLSSRTEGTERHPPGATRRKSIGRGWKQAERHSAKRR